MSEMLWKPSDDRIQASNLRAFMQAVARDWNVQVQDYDALYHWSVAQSEAFWRSVWDFTGIQAETRGEVVLENPDRMPGARFFPQARLNFAQNLLRRRDETAALVFWGEKQVKGYLTHRELYDEVSRLARALRDRGVTTGDRVAAFMPNMPETVIGMLAATSLGAVWSSCSPDFGVRGVVDRFGQIEPKVLIAVEGYYYNGKSHDCLGKLQDIMAQLPTVRTLVMVPYTRQDPPLAGLDKAVMLADFIRPYEPEILSFPQLPFGHPLYIMFSSGTTGVPKCIVHSAGGTLLQQLKEHVLHVDVKPGDRVFYFTTCGWMMWNWLVAALAAEATLLLYDGSPFFPDGNVLFDYAQAEGMTVFGTSAKYIDAVNKAGLEPAQTHDLSSVRAILSTGSPLVPESFDFVYDKVKSDVQLSSISGGTDILSCFALGCPILPVYRGELQCRGLGMAVEVWDDQGRAVQGEKGELVCVKPFPSMPIGFWNDPEQKKYRSAYYETYPDIWHHGDYVELTEHGGLVFYGRSDAVLNPGGVRIGTAEIYRQVEQLDQVVESLVIGQDWQGDVRVVLFVRLREGVELDDALVKKIKDQIRRNTTPRHVPAKVIPVTDIPRTKSGKIVELAVRDLVHGRAIKNKEALANPEALDLYRDLPELKV